jgi:hypothetical protein
MRRTLRVLGLSLLCASALAAGEAFAQVAPEQDLFAVITLRGLPCGKVIEHQKRAENDYDVVCETGDRYRVYVKDDRVEVEKR